MSHLSISFDRDELHFHQCKRDVKSNKRYRKSKGQTEMDNSKTHATRQTKMWHRDTCTKTNKYVTQKNKRMNNTYTWSLRVHSYCYLYDTHRINHIVKSSKRLLVVIRKKKIYVKQKRSITFWEMDVTETEHHLCRGRFVLIFNNSSFWEAIEGSMPREHIETYQRLVNRNLYPLKYHWIVFWKLDKYVVN